MSHEVKISSGGERGGDYSCSLCRQGWEGSGGGGSQKSEERLVMTCLVEPGRQALLEAQLGVGRALGYRVPSQPPSLPPLPLTTPPPTHTPPHWQGAPAHPSTYPPPPLS